MPLGGHQATNDDAGPAINVISWFLVATAFLTVTLRAVTKGLLTSLATDDYLIFVSLAMYILTTIAAGLQVDNGFGQHIVKTTESQRIVLQKATYARDALFVLILASSKLSVLGFLRMLSPALAHRMIMRVSIWVISLWAVTAFVIAIFQCKTPTVWRIYDHESCLNRTVFLIYVNVVNILFETVLISFPTYILANMQTSMYKKSLLISCFVARVLIVGALSAEIALELRSPPGDETWNNWPAAIARHLASSLSIVIACIPYYVSWVPHAFKIYADMHDDVSPKRFKLIQRPAMFTRRNFSGDMRNDDPLVDEEGRSRSDTDLRSRNPMLIRKTTEFQIQTEQGSQMFDISNVVVPNNMLDKRSKSYS